MSDKISILVVDDSNLIRYKVKSIFENYEVDILELNNAEDLFRFARKYQNVNLIILDINLPDMNGIETLEQFQQDSAWLHVPVVMLTSKADRLTVQKALQAGAIGYIRKPFTDDEVLDRIQKILGPLPLSGNNKNIWSREEIIKNINLETERAKIGNYSVSFVKLDSSCMTKAPDIYKLIELKNIASKELHEVDIAVITPDHQLLFILPFTKPEGAASIVDNINKNYKNEDNVEIKSSSITFPDTCRSKDEILRALGIMI